MKYPGFEYVIGLMVLALVLGLSSNIFYALIAQCVAWIIISLALKRHVIATIIHALALVVVTLIMIGVR